MTPSTPSRRSPRLRTTSAPTTTPRPTRPGRPPTPPRSPPSRRPSRSSSPRPCAPPASGSRSPSRARASSPSSTRSRPRASGSSRRATRAPRRSPPRRTASSPAGRRPASGPGPSAPPTSPSASIPRRPTPPRCSSWSARSTAAFRGREAFQEVDLVETIGRLAKWAGEIDDPATAPPRSRRRSGPPSRAARPGRPLAPRGRAATWTLPEGTPRPGRPRRTPTRPAASDVRAVLHLLAAAERPVILAGAGVLRARCSNDLVRFAELLHVPVIAALAARRRVPNDHAALPRHGRLRRPRVVADRLRTADALLVIGSRLSEVTTAGYTLPAPGQRWMHVDLEPREAAVGDRRRPSSRSAPTRGRSCARPWRRLKEAVLIAAPVAARDGNNGADRAAWEAAAEVDGSAWDGPGVHPGPDHRRAPAAAPRRRDPDHRRRRVRRLGGARLPVPPARHVPRPDLGRDGLRLPGGARGRARPPRAARRRAARRRRHGHVPRRGRDGRPRGAPRHRDRVRQRALRDDPRPPGPARAARRRRATDLGPLDFAAAARACGARGVRVDTDAAFEPALRTALAASGPTVIQLVARPALGVRRPARDGLSGR